MNEFQNLIAELESEAADCELLGSLSADPAVRDANRKRALELQHRAWAIREAHPERRTA